jgi:aminoglycoside phosphotransferase (APT) family kinase protein
MALGSPLEARWARPEPRSALLKDQVSSITNIAFPGRRVAGVQPLIEGLRNANFKVHLDSPAECVVVRLYEHDPSLCGKEIDLLRLLGPLIPVHQVTFAQPGGLEDVPPFVALRFIEGVTLRELKRTGETGAVAQAAFASGKILARIHSIAFQNSGWIGPGLEVSAPLETTPRPRFVDDCLASSQLQQRMDLNLRDRFQALIWSSANQISDLCRHRCLVHGDFGERNLLVRRAARKWTVAAVLDWEFAVSGSPLTDVGHFLR